MRQFVSFFFTGSRRCFWNTDEHLWYGGLYVPHKIVSVFYKREELQMYFVMIALAIFFPS